MELGQRTDNKDADEFEHDREPGDPVPDPPPPNKRNRREQVHECRSCGERVREGRFTELGEQLVRAAPDRRQRQDGVDDDERSPRTARSLVAAFDSRALPSAAQAGTPMNELAPIQIWCIRKTMTPIVSDATPRMIVDHFVRSTRPQKTAAGGMMMATTQYIQNSRASPTGSLPVAGAISAITNCTTSNSSTSATAPTVTSPGFRPVAPTMMQKTPAAALTRQSTHVNQSITCWPPSAC
ncbi:hypothetical protein ACFPRL_31360 [Pseudoclavibacter helvolus]